MSALELMPLALTMASDSWRARDPEPFGLDVDLLLVHDADDGGYRPTVTITRRAAAGDLDDGANATVASCGSRARVVQRAAGDANISQVIARPGPEDVDLYIVESVMRWRSPVPELVDTDVVVRLMALEDRVRELTADLARVIGSMTPVAGAPS